MFYNLHVPNSSSCCSCKPAWSQDLCFWIFCKLCINSIRQKDQRKDEIKRKLHFRLCFYLKCWKWNAKFKILMRSASYGAFEKQNARKNVVEKLILLLKQRFWDKNIQIINKDIGKSKLILQFDFRLEAIIGQVVQKYYLVQKGSKVALNLSSSCFYTRLTSNFKTHIK